MEQQGILIDYTHLGAVWLAFALAWGLLLRLQFKTPWTASIFDGIFHGGSMGIIAYVVPIWAHECLCIENPWNYICGGIPLGLSMYALLDN